MNIKTSLSHRSTEPEKGVLYIVGTPIGNLNDISFRAIKILNEVDVVACEDTRQTKKIMTKYEIKNKLISFNKDNSFQKIPKILNYLKAENSIALVSDAGLPSICDPGEDLIRGAKLIGIDIICVPGPCAATTALVSSGMPSSSFIFEGFLPKKDSEREKVLYEINNNQKTTILFESPHRIIKLLRELKKFCGGEREIQVSRELTKKFEEHIGNNINQVLEHFESKNINGEFTILIKGIEKTRNLDIDKLRLKKELNELIEAGLSLSAASKYLAKKENIAKSIIYKLH